MRNLQKIKKEKKERRRRYLKVKNYGTAQKPRLSVFKSLKHIYAQIINDEKGTTLAAASDQELKKKSHKFRIIKKGIKKEKTDEKIRSGKVAIAYEVGKLIAEKALKKKIKNVVFDRSGFKYHGRIKSLAEGARESGLNF